jgi:glutamate racemase
MIGVLDSGLGGLTVLREFSAQLPGYDITYFGDTAGMPYANKSPAVVIENSLRNVDFLLSRGVKIVVMTSHSACSVALESVLKEIELPLFEIITPAVERAVQISRKLRIGVIGARGTVKSGIYPQKLKQLNPNIKVYSAASPLLIPLIEEGWHKKPETAMIVKKYLRPLKVRQIDTLILGCTHYLLLEKIIQRKIGQRVRLIDASAALVESVKTYLERHVAIDNQLSKKGNLRLLLTDVTDCIQNTARTVLKTNVSLERVRGLRY